MRLLPTTANAIQRINLRWTILCGVAINVRFELLASCAQALGQFTHEAIARFVATLSARPQLRRITYKMVCLDIASLWSSRSDTFVMCAAIPYIRLSSAPTKSRTLQIAVSSLPIGFNI
jgi:hypothetical protein